MDAVRWGGVAVAASWVIGLPISMVVSRLVLFDWDARSWVVAAIGIGLIGLVAAFLPARKAARIDVASVLRM
jgi:ABC-type antimicrobial peptide transport system permease subunit